MPQNNKREYDDETIMDRRDAEDLDKELLDEYVPQWDSYDLSATLRGMSGKLERKIVSTKKTPSRSPTSANKTPRGTYNAEGRWVLEAVAMEDYSGDDNENTKRKGVFHAFAQA